MTIRCNKEFADACAFADSADAALEAAIACAKDENEAEKLRQCRGKAKSTLLHCIGTLAKWDSDYNEGGRRGQFRSGTSVTYVGGITKITDEMADCRLPVRETFLYYDMSPHSFFFREVWVDPDTYDPVEIREELHYSGDGSKIDQAKLDSLSGEELLHMFMNGDLFLLKSRDELDNRKKNGCCTRTVIRRRNGLCGGIIYHPVYADGKAMPYGSWSIHT